VPNHQRPITGNWQVTYRPRRRALPDDGFASLAAAALAGVRVIAATGMEGELEEDDDDDDGLGLRKQRRRKRIASAAAHGGGIGGGGHLRIGSDAQ
jgi:hypothetical protein